MSEITPRRPGQAVTLQNRAEAEKKVGKKTRQQQIATILEDYPDGLTAREIAYHLAYRNYTRTMDRNNAAPRLNEMWRDGRVEVIGTRKCDETGKTVAVYRLVSEIPR